MRTRIQNSDDLRSEILRLRTIKAEIEGELKVETNRITNRFSLPFMLFGKVNDWVRPMFKPGRNEPGSLNQDWVSSIFRIGLPVVMNKFIFPKSGFLLKSLVDLLFQGTAKTVNQDVLSNLIDRLSNWIKSSKRKKKQEPELEDYGIPPDSETY